MSNRKKENSRQKKMNLESCMEQLLISNPDPAAIREDMTVISKRKQRFLATIKGWQLLKYPRWCYIYLIHIVH